MKVKTEKKKKNINSTKFNMGLYRVLEDRSLNFPYGPVSFHAKDLVIMPHHLPIQKRLEKTMELVFAPLQKSTDLNGKRLLINRYGGIGDLLCILPAITELKQKFPTCKIGMMSSYSYLPLFYNFPKLIEGAVNNIVLYNQAISNFDYFVDLDQLVEKCPDKTANIHDVYADALFVKVTNESINNTIKQNILAQKDNSAPRRGIGIQYKSNAILRDYPIDSWIAVINQLNQLYPNELIYLLGKPDDFLNVNYIQSRTQGKVIPNGCSAQNEGLSLNETFEIVSSLKCVISADSSMIHMAGLTNTPIIGIYGPFSSASRISKYNHYTAITNDIICAPCTRHQPLAWCKWTGGESLCLKDISPDSIIKQTKNILDTFYQN